MIYGDDRYKEHFTMTGTWSEKKLEVDQKMEMKSCTIKLKISVTTEPIGCACE